MNAIGTVTFRVNIPEEKLIVMAGMPGSAKWYEQACDKAEEWIGNNVIRAIETLAIEPPDIEIER